MSMLVRKGSYFWFHGTRSVDLRHSKLFLDHRALWLADGVAAGFMPVGVDSRRSFLGLPERPHRGVTWVAVRVSWIIVVC